MDSMEILQRIVAADKAARERYETTRQLTSSAESRADALEREMTERALEKARRDVEDEKQRLLDEADATARQLDAEHQLQLDEMKQKFEAQQDACAEKMFRMAVGLE